LFEGERRKRRKRGVKGKDQGRGGVETFLLSEEVCSLRSSGISFAGIGRARWW
jgi:hypothetical protein